MLTFNNASVVIALDGNSNIDSSATTDPTKTLRVQLAALAPLNGNVTIKNLARGGATWQTMIAGNDGSGIDQVHAAFEPGKQNLLFVMENFNTAYYGATSDFIMAKCKEYITAVHAVHPEWRVFLMTVPAGKDDEGIGFNVAVDECNTYMRANYAELGAEGLIELRPPGGPFDYSPPYVYTESTFTKGPGYYRDASHWSDLGISVVSQYMADFMKTIPDAVPSLTLPQKFARLRSGVFRLRNGAPAVTQS